MKRIFYVSRFSRRLSPEDLDAIHTASAKNNPEREITGFLVCLGDTFFQVIEGPPEAVDDLYFKRILPDPRHQDVVCIRSDNEVSERMFPDWRMKTFNLNEHAETLPFAFREMLTALLDSHLTIARYTQPSITAMLERGINPHSVEPSRRIATVLYSDIIGFSRFAEHLAPKDLIELVNSHAEVCIQSVSKAGGEVNKLTGDGVLSYFSGDSSDAAVDCAKAIVHEMSRRRDLAGPTSPHRLLYAGVGITHGFVFEGNVGTAMKRDFTILGNTVNLAARLESMTRDLNVRLTMESSVVQSSNAERTFHSLGKHTLKGQSKAIELFTLSSLPPLDINLVWKQIEDHINVVC